MSGAERVLAEIGDRVALHRDPETIALCSSDVFERACVPPFAVAEPKSQAEMALLARAAARHGIMLRPRGAGLSYTAGYLPQAESDIIVDCRSIDSILSIDEHNLVAVVEAGCTWKSLRDALQEKGLETEISPPISGERSTVGGGVSQGLPGSMDGVLSLSVLLPSGAEVTTGSVGYDAEQRPFTRMPGPDLTGLFIGDCGRFGIKTRVALRLRTQPSHVDHLAFLFPDLKAMANAAARIGRSSVASRCMGLSPDKARQAKTPGLSEALASGWEIFRASGPLQAIRVATQALRPLPFGWPLYVSIEGGSRAELKQKARLVRTLASAACCELDTAIPEALHARPFSIRGAAGPEGEAWVPIHGLFAPSQSEQVADALNSFLEARKDKLEKAGIGTGLLVSASGAQILFEPMFMWRDQLSPVVREYIDTQRIRGYSLPRPNPETRRLVELTRRELRDLFYELGAAFLQKGSFYPDYPVSSGIPALLAGIDDAVGRRFTTFAQTRQGAM